MDRATFESLVKIHQAEVYRYVRYLGADNDAAEDVVQETFLTALRSNSSIDTSAQAAWLRGVARNMFLRHCRRVRNSPVQTSSDLIEQAEALWAGEFLRRGDGYDYVAALRTCLESLPASQRNLLDQRYAQQASRSEMAHSADMTENGIKASLRRIRASLADCIRKRLEAEQL